jgi:sugar-phosphatase
MGRPLDAALLHEAIERKAVLYERAIRASLELVPGSADFIRAAAAEGIRLAIVSGALRREIELVLGESGLREEFELIVAAEDVSACKPNPQGYLAARQQLGLPEADCMVIEDSLAGLAAARGAGVRCTMITTSHPAAELSGADLVWTNLSGHHPRDLPWMS